MRRREPPEELAHYRLGAKVRRMRLKKKISLEELGRHTGLSAALLSKLERDRVMPTLPTLLRIALVFGVGLEQFFVVDLPGAMVVRRADRIRFPERADDPHCAFDFESLDYLTPSREMNAYLADFRPRQTVRPHVHDAAEFVYVVCGDLLVQVEDRDHLLHAGDSIYIQPAIPHGYARRGDGVCQALVVTTATPTAAMRVSNSASLPHQRSVK